MTNLERWRSYLDGLISPDSYINFGYHYLISAALQRRVWIGPDHQKLYPNQFTTLTGPPGVGKGLVIKKVIEALRYWKLEAPGEVNKKDIDSTTSNLNYSAGKAEEERLAKSNKNYDKPLLIPMAADASTYEALTGAMARSLRFINYNQTLPDGEKKKATYFHSSICFGLEEVSSLFRKRSDDVVNFMIVGYDCGDYTKDTKHHGVDKIQQCCLNFLGGTTPSFMQRSFTDGLLNEGYASRNWFIYESRNRKVQVFAPDLSSEQIVHREEVYQHIKNLTGPNIFGRVELTKEAEQFIEEWWQYAQSNKPNTNERLQYYYARKQIHVLKLALAKHFGESLEMRMGIEPCKWAVKTLDAVETRMHHALLTKSENPYFKVGQRIIEFLTDNGPRSEKQLLAYFWEQLPSSDPKEALMKILEHYITTGVIEGSGEVYKIIKEESSGLQ